MSKKKEDVTSEVEEVKTKEKKKGNNNSIRYITRYCCYNSHYIFCYVFIKTKI